MWGGSPLGGGGLVLVEFAEETYYQVMFKSPVNILFEIVYTGPLTNK